MVEQRGLAVSWRRIPKKVSLYHAHVRTAQRDDDALDAIHALRNILVEDIAKRTRPKSTLKKRAYRCWIALSKLQRVLKKSPPVPTEEDSPLAVVEEENVQTTPRKALRSLLSSTLSPPRMKSLNQASGLTSRTSEQSLVSTGMNSNTTSSTPASSIAPSPVLRSRASSQAVFGSPYEEDWNKAMARRRRERSMTLTEVATGSPSKNPLKMVRSSVKRRLSAATTFMGDYMPSIPGVTFIQEMAQGLERLNDAIRKSDKTASVADEESDTEGWMDENCDPFV